MCPLLDQKSAKSIQKGDKLWKSKLPETRAFKGICYTTKKSCTDGGNPTKKNFFWVASHIKHGGGLAGMKGA